MSMGNCIGRADLRGAVSTLQTMAPGFWSMKSGCAMAEAIGGAGRRIATGPWERTIRER